MSKFLDENFSFQMSKIPRRLTYLPALDSEENEDVTSPQPTAPPKQKCCIACMCCKKKHKQDRIEPYVGYLPEQSKWSEKYQRLSEST